MNIFFKYIWQILLSLFIMLGIILVVAILSGIFMGLVGQIMDPLALYAWVSLGPQSIYFWGMLLIIIGIFISPSLLLTIWVFKDSKKFNASGINTSPFFWAMGVLLPTIIIFLPLYLIKRNILWVK